MTLVCLAVCAWSLGFGLTDWVCDSNEKALARSHSDAKALASHRARLSTATGALPLAPVVEVTEPARGAEAEPSAPALNVARVQKRSSRSRPGAVARSPRASASRDSAPEVAVAAVEEPSPVLSVDEANTALALAEASKRIFASVDEAAPQPVRVRPPPTAAVVQRPAAREAKVVAIEALSVDGGLPSNVVNRSVQRLLPQYDRCREYCDSAPQRLKLTTTIDEAGRGRHVTVEGLSRPVLRRCLEQATAHLVVPAPDTGTARAHWTVRFVP